MGFPDYDHDYERTGTAGGSGSGIMGGYPSSSAPGPGPARGQGQGQGYAFTSTGGYGFGPGPGPGSNPGSVISPGSGPGSIGRTNGYAVNLNPGPNSNMSTSMNGSGILGGKSSEDRFSSLGSSNSNSGSSVFDPGGYAGSGSGSAFGQREVQGQHPRSRMVFASQTFVPPGSGQAGSSVGGPVLSPSQLQQQQQQQQQQQGYHQMYTRQGTGDSFYPSTQSLSQPQAPPQQQQSQMYHPNQIQPQGIIQQPPRQSNGHALGLGGIDDSPHPGIVGGSDERARGRQMSQMEKAIFGAPGTLSAGLSSGSVSVEVDKQGRMRGRPDTVVDRLLRREEDEDGGLDEEGDEREGRDGVEAARGRGQPDRLDENEENVDAAPGLVGANGRTSSRTRTRTRTRSRSKRRGGRSRSDSRNPSSRLGQSRGTSRSRIAGGMAGESDKEDVYGDRDGFGSGRGVKREGLGKKPVEREEISTIFMVGFPDDITEREFSNIFTFAHGFEAASLKFPNAPSVLPAKDATTPTLSLPLAVQQQLGIYTGESMKSSDNASPSKRDGDDGREDDESMIAGAGSEPVRALPAATAAALGLGLGQNSTASSSTTSLIGMLNSANRGPPRRQVIGFARFRTRADALVARDTLQGRKIDVFSSATLKVEMAKKNLHSRRGFGSGPLSLSGVPESEVMDVLMRSGKLPGLLAGMGMGGFVLSRERSNGSQGQARHPESIAGGNDLRSGASTPSGRRMSMSDSFATLTMAGPNVQTNAPGIAQQSGSQPMPSLGQATEETADFAPRATLGQMDQGAPVFSPRYASMDLDQTPMNNKTQKHRRNDSLRSVFSADWSNPLKLSQVPEHPFPSSAFNERRSDEHLSAQLGSSLSGSAASGAALSGSSPASGIQSDRQASMLSSSDPTSPGPGFTSPAYSVPKDSKALLALAEDDDEDWNVGGVGMEALGSFDGESRNNSPAPNRNETSITSPTTGYEDLNQTTPGAARRDDQSFVPRALTGLNGRRSIPGMMGPRSLSDFGGVASLNIADQNPPINTLYVGNLPSHLAVTQSANYLEECLRNLFTRASGFKRMSFRQKVNGPMCFVEFESVEFATLAIKDLYGNTLGGLVKGGLRLSYSKNSLGQRGNAQPAQPTRINTSHSMTASDATSPGSYAAGGLSPSSSLNGIPYIANYVPGRNDSNESGMSSSFKSETPLSPLAVPFNGSSLPHEAMIIATSPRLQRFPSSGSEGRQTRDGSLAPISPRAAFSAPWPMTSINPQGPQYGNMAAPGGGGYDNAFPRSS